MQITVCGGGNAAHTSAGILGARKEYQVNVYASFDDEAQRWQKGIAGGGITVTSPDGSIVGHPRKVSSDPAEVIPGSQVVLLALPAFAHELVLEQIAPYLEEGAVLGALAARGCFDLCARDVLKQKANKMTIFGLQTLPWACRIKHYGQEVTPVEVCGRSSFCEFFLDFVMEYWAEIFQDFRPDCALIWEDMASKNGSLISPACCSNGTTSKSGRGGRSTASRQEIFLLCRRRRPP